MHLQIYAKGEHTHSEKYRIDFILDMEMTNIEYFEIQYALCS